MLVVPHLRESNDLNRTPSSRSWCCSASLASASTKFRYVCVFLEWLQWSARRTKIHSVAVLVILLIASRQAAAEGIPKSSAIPHLYWLRSLGAQIWKLQQSPTKGASTSSPRYEHATGREPSTLTAKSSPTDFGCPAPGDGVHAYTAGPPIPISGTGRVRVVAIGPSEIVYDHNADGCYTAIPDTGTRAYRDAHCTTNMIISQVRAYRATGPSLDQLAAPSCKPIFQSTHGSGFDREEYNEWISAIYTDDGLNVYALLHDEWYPSLVDKACSAKDNVEFRIDSITLAISADGGATFHHPTNYKLFHQGSPWSSSYSCDPKVNLNGVWGPSEPSNIVRSGRYLYLVFWQGRDPAIGNAAGVCAARTADITRAGMWQVHTHSGWVKALNNLCDPLANVGGMHTGLSFNTYLDQFVLVGAINGAFDGVYLSVSHDMVTWSTPEKILPMKHGKIALGTMGGSQGYASLLDPTDNSLNFQNTGQMPYLYFVLQPAGSVLNSLNIVRQQIKLQKLAR